MNSLVTISIDGGAGSGKSTTAYNISRKLNFLHVDTGSHYRAISFSLLKNGIEPHHIKNVTDLNKIKLNYFIHHSRASILINNFYTPKTLLRSEIVNNVVSQYSSNSIIRDLLFEYQRSYIQIAKDHKFRGLVMEGRDIGTVILPDADLKYFLHADDSVRTSRRSLDGEFDQIQKRDYIDTTRSIAPLIAAQDSKLINTGKFTINDVYKIISEEIRNL